MFGRKTVTYTALTDEDLMILVSKGERQAFETVYDRYFNKLVWFARGFFDNLHHAEDTVQDVFIKLVESPGQFDTSRKFSTWIYVVTSNRCKQALRDQKNRNRIIEENVLPFNEQVVELANTTDLKTLKKRIQTIYAELNEKEKNIYTLRFEQELPIKDIAEILAIPEGSVKSGIYYLLKKFAYHLKDFSHGT